MLNYQRVVVLLLVFSNGNVDWGWTRTLRADGWEAHTLWISKQKKCRETPATCAELFTLFDVGKLWGFKSLSLSQEKGSCLDSERHHGDAGSSGCAGMRLSSFCLPFAKPDRCFGSLLAISSASGSIILMVGCTRDLLYMSYVEIY